MPRKNSKTRKELRRKIAAENLKKRSKLSDEQQLKHLDDLGFAAVKERAKLKARIAAAAANKEEE